MILWEHKFNPNSWTFKKFLHRRFKAADVAGSVSKGAPDFCTVYVIAKGKIQSMRAASRSAPVNSSWQNQLNRNSTTPASMDAQTPRTQVKRGQRFYFLLLFLRLYFPCSKSAPIDRLLELLMYFQSVAEKPPLELPRKSVGDTESFR